MDENNLGNEIILKEEDLIVSATDAKGIILYTNEIFTKVAGYDKAELIGQPHNIIRHFDMPKTIFKLLWDTVLEGKTLYAFVKNISKNGDFYWVKAYIKPVINKEGEIEQIISYRKPINDFAKTFIIGLYATLLEYEKTHTVDESLSFLMKYLEKRSLTYEQFIDRLSLGKSVENPTALNIDVGALRNAHLLFKQKIITDTNEKKQDIKVIGSCCCEFGKWVQTIENESFTKLNTWNTVITYHNKIHQNMEEYVKEYEQQNSKEKLNKIAHEVEENVQTMFENLVATIDTSKE